MRTRAGPQIHQPNGWMLGCARNKEVIGDRGQSVGVNYGIEIEGCRGRQSFCGVYLERVVVG